MIGGTRSSGSGSSTGTPSTLSSARTLCVPECIVNRRKAAVVEEEGKYTSAAISAELAALVAKKAFALEVAIIDELLNLEHRHGQAGLIQNPYLPTMDSSPPSAKKQKIVDRYGDAQQKPALKASASAQRVSVLPVTALHNVVNDSVRGVHYKANGIPFMANAALNGDSFVGKAQAFSGLLTEVSSSDGINVNVSNTNSDGSVADPETETIPVSWKYGVDISQGEASRKKTFPFTDSNLSFQVVGPDFEYKIGQKIGMAVYRNYEFDFNSAGGDSDDIYSNNEWDRSLSQNDILQLFGPDNSVSIYTGEITYMSNDRKVIGHNINTYKGCSGAIVFLLDKNQNELIAGHEAGKAIAVHAGSVTHDNTDNTDNTNTDNTNTNINIAFTVRHLVGTSTKPQSPLQVDEST